MGILKPDSICSRNSTTVICILNTAMVGHHKQCTRLWFRKKLINQVCVTQQQCLKLGSDGGENEPSSLHGMVVIVGPPKAMLQSVFRTHFWLADEAQLRQSCLTPPDIQIFTWIFTSDYIVPMHSSVSKHWYISIPSTSNLRPAWSCCWLENSQGLVPLNTCLESRFHDKRANIHQIGIGMHQNQLDDSKGSCLWPPLWHPKTWIFSPDWLRAMQNPCPHIVDPLPIWPVVPSSRDRSPLCNSNWYIQLTSSHPVIAIDVLQKLKLSMLTLEWESSSNPKYPKLGGASSSAITLWSP